MNFKSLSFIPVALLAFLSCAPKTNNTKTDTKASTVNIAPQDEESVATFASGCFWCVEEVYESLLGVREVISGYSGGKAEDANYSDVSSGRTDHAESVQIYYDTTIISFAQLVSAFFASHDPTTLNQQGPDHGRQYRSIAFYRNEKEKEVILNEIKKLTDSGEFEKPIVTEVVPFTAFYPAEDYHQDYISRNPDDPYVKNVSKPRYERFKKAYKGTYKE
jgi:peptide-methionine (S)-S-oxide reductase